MIAAPSDAVLEWVRALQAYAPGRPVREIERETGRRVIQLASNESPLGPSPRALEAARTALEFGNRYTQGGNKYLREALAARHGVAFENVILGAGSSEVITFAARALLAPGCSGVTSASTFPLYPINIAACGARATAVPLRGFSIDLERMAGSLPANTKIIFLANPNNPTGTMFPADEFEAFLRRVPQHVLVVIDEAYAEYVERADDSRSIELVREGRNVLLLRTFSKVYGLAGFRIGYGIGAAALLAEMNKLRALYNTSGVAEAAALAALDDSAHVARSLDCNRKGMAQLARGLNALAVPYVQSFGNFVLLDLEREAKPISAELYKRGILVPAMGFAGLPNALRVTVGIEDENAVFLNALGEVLGAA